MESSALLRDSYSLISGKMVSLLLVGKEERSFKNESDVTWYQMLQRDVGG